MSESINTPSARPANMPTPPPAPKKWPARLLNLLILVLATYGVWAIYDQYVSTNSDNDLVSNSSTANETAPETADSDNSISTSTVEKGWLVYTSNTKGFSISYPADWTAQTYEGDDLAIPTVQLTMPASTAIEADISVYYYPSIAMEPENAQNNLGATTLDEYVAKDSMLTKIGATTLDGAPGYDVILGGEGAYYTVLAVSNQHFYKVMFNTHDSKSQLTTTEKKILDSIKLNQ